MPERPKIDDGAGTGSDLLVELRAKYLQLSRKYAALVRRLEVRTSELVQHRSGGASAVYRLGFWALNATASGLALVKDGAVTLKGKVQETKQKTKAEKIAKKVGGVKSVVNNIQIEHP